MDAEEDVEEDDDDEDEDDEDDTDIGVDDIDRGQKAGRLYR